MAFCSRQKSLVTNGNLFLQWATIQLAQVRLNHIKFNSSSRLTPNLSFSLTVKVHNCNLFQLNYNSLDMSVGYKGRDLGFVSSQGERMRSRASLYMNRLEVIHNVFYLLEDLPKGVIPFDADTQVNGMLGLFFFKIILKVYIHYRTLLI